MSPRTSIALFERLAAGAAGLPALHVATALPAFLVAVTALAADRLALGVAAPSNAGPDSLGPAGGFLLRHPSGERHENVLHLATAVQPAFLHADQRAAALAKLADDPRRTLGALTRDPVKRSHDQDRKLALVRVIEHLLDGRSSASSYL